MEYADLTLTPLEGGVNFQGTLDTVTSHTTFGHPTWMIALVVIIVIGIIVATTAKFTNNENDEDEEKTIASRLTQVAEDTTQAVTSLFNRLGGN
jgi:hypothetical protein